MFAVDSKLGSFTFKGFFPFTLPFAAFAPKKTIRQLTDPTTQFLIAKDQIHRSSCHAWSSHAAKPPTASNYIK